MPQGEEKPKAELPFPREDWERLISSLERLMALQRKTLQRLKDLKRRNEELSQKLRKATSAASRSKLAPQHRIEVTSELGRARVEPERALAAVGVKCSCGRELASGAKFCDQCGRSV